MYELYVRLKTLMGISEDGPDVAGRKVAGKPRARLELFERLRFPEPPRDARAPSSWNSATARFSDPAMREAISDDQSTGNHCVSRTLGGRPMSHSAFVCFCFWSACPNPHIGQKGKGVDASQTSQGRGRPTFRKRSQTFG